MKYFFPLLYLLFLYSCTQQNQRSKEVPVVLKEYLTPVRDTFNTRDLAREPSLQADIALDTIDIPMNKGI
jgi:hypothetical protein